MKIRNLFLVSLLSASISMSAQSVAQNPITKAMMDVYAQEIEADPHNYEVYFRRANEYYNLSQYLRALSDIDEAIKYTPASDTDLQYQEYLLRGNIYLMSDRPTDALADFDKAYSLDPTSLTALCLKADTEYEVGKYAESKADFSKLLRNDQHNLEALYGLARIAIKENNLGLATEYSDRAVQFEPSNGIPYLNRAEVRRLMGNNNGAVDDLIMAMSVDKENGVALQRLVSISNEDYAAVITGLTTAMQQAPAVGMFPYLRAYIAMSHYRYKSAIDDFNFILDENLYNYHGIYASLAQCYLAIGKYQEALNEINQALSMTTDNGEYYIVRAKIRRAMGDNDRALESAATALDKMPASPAAMVEKALCEVSCEQYRDASSLLGEAIMDEPDNAEYYLIRAHVMTDCLKENAAAVQLYQRVVDLDLPANSVKSFKGFAQAQLGNKTEAIAWMDSILDGSKDVDGSLHYYGACFYASVGDKDRALDSMEKSLENGYADYYNWTVTDDSVVSVAPIRNEARFKTLLDRFGYLFN